MLQRITLTNFVLAAAVVACVAGTLRDARFWQTADQQGDALARRGSYADAAKAYSDPWRVGWAQYRNGDFAAASGTFARVPGAVGAFNQGDALLMHGSYDDAIAAYDRALKFRGDWPEAVENRALAIARRDRITKEAENESSDNAAYDPDDVVFDGKGDDAKGKPIELAGGQPLSDEALQATWLRRVQTTPGDFLRAKFAYQAQQAEAPP